MDPSQVLKQRGIEDEARWAGWEDGPNPYNQRTPGWTYPVFRAAGDPITDLVRWKAADSAYKTKYVWWPKGADNHPTYYLLPGTLDAIRGTGGELHMVSGEPDVLTMVSAGIANVTCPFGEKNISDLAEGLALMGVRRLIYWRDRDTTGYEAARTARDALLSTDIEFECRVLDGAQYDEKYDLNRLWIDCRFDAEVFVQVLTASRIEDLPPTPVQPVLAAGPAPPPSDDARDLYEAWCHEVEQAAVRVWNLAPPDRQEFSKGMILCPFHQEKTPSAHWNYRTHGLRCHGACGQEYNTHEVAEHLGHESWEDYKQRHRPMRTSAQNGRQPRRRRSRVRLVSRRDAAREAREILTGQRVPEVEPFLCPYVPLRQFGGLAKLHEPGQVGLFISGSGMGKTSFVERVFDNLNRDDGSDGVLYGPEWEPRRYQTRAVTRYGGPSVEAQMEHETWEFEKANKVSSRSANPLDPAALQRAAAILADIETWTGNTHYVESDLPLFKALREAGEMVEDLRAQGRRLRLAAFDYAQLELGTKQGWHELEMFLAEVQEWSKRFKMFSYVVSQVNKGEAAKLKERGTLFTADSAQLLSDQRTKLVVTLNPVYLEGARYEKAWIQVVKNNIGAVPARILVKTALYRHDWTDEVLEGLTNEPLPNHAQTALNPPDENENGDGAELHLRWYEK